MAKYIKVTPEIREQCEKEFEESIVKARESFNNSFIDRKNMHLGKISMSFGAFTHTFDAPACKATLHFTIKAWLKMNALVSEYSTEVGWHGVAYRDESGEGNDYYITDIVVYPQVVDGTNVNTDQAEYEKWLMDLDDETFNNLRMQGHSHVNMGVTPSVVDETHQEKILDTLTGDMFQIFMIWNKKSERTIRIYDLKKNILFETPDVTVMIPEEVSGISDFVRDSREIVKNRTYSYGRSYSQNTYGKPASVKTFPSEPAKKEESKKTSQPVNSSTPPVKDKSYYDRDLDYLRDYYGYDYDDPDEEYNSPFYSSDKFFRGSKK